MNGLHHHNSARLLPKPFKPILIRLAEPDDIPTLQQLVEAAARILTTDDYSASQIEQGLKQRIIGLDFQLIADRTYFVAEYNQHIVGCGGWSKRRASYGTEATKSAEDIKLLDPDREPAQIRAFFVHPKYARRGIGRMILQTSEQAARAAGFKRLALTASLTGEPLYTAMGFQALEHIKIPLNNGESLVTIRMEKRL